MKKRILSLLLALELLVSLCGCGSAAQEQTAGAASAGASSAAAEAESTAAPAAEAVSTAEAADAESGEETWAIYWYMCGSNLESDDGSATADLEELQQVALPENVTVVIETGGASAWKSSAIDADALDRFAYNSEGMWKVDTLENASMGEEATLADFLSFCNENYDADHKLLLFWDHGGGSVGGVASDENYGNDSLTLSEMAGAFESTCSEKNFDLIGFDTCLMATLDTAYMAEPYADYLVASEELEPGNGWSYDGWVAALAADPTISPANLGISICDSYMEGCKEYETADAATLAVIDLNQIDPLISNLNSYGISLLSAASGDSGVLSEFSRDVDSAANYGGNSRVSGYTNMVDLGDLAEKTAELAGDSAAAVEESLSNAVVYQVCGEAREGATGLSIYYPLDSKASGVSSYSDVTASDVYTCLLNYLVTGSLPENTQEAVEQAEADSNANDLPEIDYENAPVIPTYNGQYTLDTDEDGNLRLTIDPDQMDTIADVTFCMSWFYDEETNDLLELGIDDDLYADWENGVFTDNFRGVWGSLNGELCYMELMSRTDECNLYSIPVTINDEDYYLTVAWHYDTEEYELLGARQSLDEESGMPDKDLYFPQEGDVVVPKFFIISEGSEVGATNGAITVGSDGLTFAEIDLDAGEYVYNFCIEDLQGHKTYTRYAHFIMDADGFIDVYVNEE